MKAITTLFAITLWSWATWLSAQNNCTSGRYAEPVFTCVDVTPNITYGQGRQNWSTTNILCQHGSLPPYNGFQTLLADLYEPCNDAETARPLIIAIHGGAWATGNKADMAPFGQAMAKRGYVVASISYRLSITPNVLCFNAEVDRIKMVRAFYRAMQDAKAAVRYFRANAAQYGIDPDKIFVGGHSAGAFTALGAGYLTDDSERPAETFVQNSCGNWLGQLICQDLGGIEGEGGNPGVSSAVKGVIPMSGALTEMSYLNGPNDPPLLLVHGTADDVVPYQSGCVLQNLGPLFTTCIPVFGSARVFTYADSIGMDVELLTLPGGGHGFTAAENDTIIAHTTRFLCCRLNGGNCATVSAHEELASAPGFSVFPNPARDELVVRTASAGSWRACLYDAGGRLMECRSARHSDTERFDLNNYPSGIYTLRFSHDGGTQAVKVLKQ